MFEETGNEFPHTLLNNKLLVCSKHSLYRQCYPVCCVINFVALICNLH